jgi:hypothetical protein
MAPNNRLYLPSDSSTLSTKPSMVSPPCGTGISGNCVMLAPMSAVSAVSRPTTSSTRAVQLSVAPASSAADTSARAVSSEETRSRMMTAMISAAR